MKTISRICAALCAVVFGFTLYDVIRHFSGGFFKMSVPTCRLPWYLVYIGGSGSGAVYIAVGALMLLMLLLAAVMLTMPPRPRFLTKLYIPFAAGAVFVFLADFIYNVYQVVSQLDAGYSIRYFTVYHAPYLLIDLIMLTLTLWCVKNSVLSSKK